MPLITTKRMEIDNHYADYIIHTNSSTTLTSKDRAFEVVITQGPANNPITINTIKEWERVFTCLFEEELAALLTPLQWTKDNNLTIGKTVLTWTERNL